MFRHIQPAASPFDTLFSELSKPDFSDQQHYPVFLEEMPHQRRKKGRFNNIFTRHDHDFPEYNANVIVHGEQRHILLEGPAQHIQDHCERFLEVLNNDWIPITDVIAAGDPLDGRKYNKGYLHYFAEQAIYDHPMLEKIAVKFHLVTRKHDEADNITTYIMHINDGEKQKEVRVHHIPKFGDFKTLEFSIKEINTLLNIFQQAETLAIHCSAGMGRTGVIELAFCLFNEHEKYFRHDKPDFQKIKLKVNELRVLRPELLQTSDQYRMAIILAAQLHAANRNELTDEVQSNACNIIDAAARDWIRTHAKLALPVAKTSRSRNVSDNESYSNEVSANSDYSDYSEDDENSVEKAVMRY